MNISDKIESIRSLMLKYGLDAYIVPSTDPHISEYVPDRYKSRAWISGFTGSVATFVVTKDQAGIWTDGRYFIQASQQLEGTEIKLHKLGIPGHLNFPEWLNKNLDENSVVGFDGFCTSISFVRSLESSFKLKNIKLNANIDLIEEVWEDRSSLPNEKIFEQSLEFSGISRNEKIAKIREGLKEQNCCTTVICSLDDISWTLNIRGRDVSYNPVVVSFLKITMESVVLYIDERKVSPEIRESLSEDGVELKSYDKIIEDINNPEGDSNILIDPSRSNFLIFSSIPSNCNVVLKQNISTDLKAIKSEAEITGMKSAMKKDLLALIKFNIWLERNYDSQNITELDAMKKLKECRAKQKLFFGESFNTIAGMAGNGAIIHYSSDESSNRKITDETFFLLDSGGQYLDGTTDITRLFHFGNPSSQERRDYTLVLKGMIDLTLQKFPAGTRGGQIDAIARQHLWNNMMDYGHGTGHGVGCFMNVHEGPQNIRKEHNPTELKEGMILSNEPGLYRADEYGIRIENLVLVSKLGDSKFGEYLGFETLTHFPIDTNCIEKSYLDKDEINWLNGYHKTIYELVQNELDDESREWLQEKTKAI